MQFEPVFQIDKVIPVFNFHLPCRTVNQLAVDILIDMFHLIQAGMGFAIRCDYAVTIEVFVAGHTFGPVIAAVRPEEIFSLFSSFVGTWRLLCR